MNNLPYLFSSCCRNTEKRLRQLHGTSSSVKNILYYDTHTKKMRGERKRELCAAKKKKDLESERKIERKIMNKNAEDEKRERVSHS